MTPTSQPRADCGAVSKARDRRGNLFRPPCKCGFDRGDALAGFDRDGTGHDADNGLAAERFAPGLGVHGRRSVGTGVILPNWPNAAHAESVGAQFIAPNTRHDESGRDESRPYEDIPGFCKSATLDEIRKHGHVLTPGRYVGAEAAEDDFEPFTDKMQRLSAQWREQQQEAARLDAAIEANLKELGYGD